MMRGPLIILLVAACACVGVRAQPVFDSLPPVFRFDSTEVDLLRESERTPIVAVRHLGAICSHCVQQIILLNEYAEEFRRHSARVFAFSMDNEDECLKATTLYGIDTSVIQLCHDKRDACSKAIGSTIREVDGSYTDLHAVLVIRDRRVVFEHYATQPLMSLGGVFEALRD